MKLWLISQDVNKGYDTYDSAVVVASTEEEARSLHPAGFDKWEGDLYSGWAHSKKEVRVKHLGETVKDTPKGVIIASFNAG